ncbi:MAG: MFS transporter [Bdellovibrionota bacterium]
MTPSRATFLFYSGLLLSSVGSLAFTTSLVAFMLKSEFSLASIGLILGLQRLLPILVVGIWGHISDCLSPKITVIVSEIIAAAASFALLLLWKGQDTAYTMFLAVCVLRSFLMSFQLGSRSKISKLLSDGQYSSNSKHAIWLMKATQGATLFGGAVAFVIIKNFSLETAIIFDLITFLLNGFIIYTIPLENLAPEDQPQETEPWYKKFSDLFKFNKDAAILDILLALSLFGWAAFSARLAGADQSWNALFTASYGLAVWIAGFMERSFAQKINSTPFWIALSLSYLGLAIFNGPHYSTLIIVFLRDISYWIILHRISSHIQHDSPIKLMGGISSARFTIMVTILSCGEMIVGAWSKFVPLWADSGLRAFVALTVGLVLLTRGSQAVVANDRPAL